VPTIFRTYSLGVSTNRDSVVYEFNPKRLAARVERFADDYNAELSRWQKKGRPQDVDNFVNYEKVKWSRNLKRWFRQETELQFDGSRIRNSVYRPYTKLALYYARKFIDEVGTTESLFPSQKSEKENSAIVVNVSPERPFCVLICNSVPSKDVAGGFGSPSYCLPHFSYSVDGRQRRDNITQKATTLFRIFYADDAISRADIFHYVYAVLHHPSYRMRFAENLRRDLPRIPFVGVVIGEKSASFFPLAAVETMQGDGKPAHNPKASAKLFHAFAKIDSHRARHGSDDVRLPN
jgi:predicted helicase